MPQAQDVFLTRLHVRYDADHFPEDLTFQETADRTNFQGRYILRHPWQGTETCREAEQYRASLPQRWDQEARTLASLTGWNIEDIRKKCLAMAALQTTAMVAEAVERLTMRHRLMGA